MNFVPNKKIKDIRTLEEIAKEIRINILKMQRLVQAIPVGHYPL